MRLWNTAALRARTLAAWRLKDDERRFAEAGARRIRDKAAFDATIARMNHDAAAPAVGKCTPADRRARI